MNFAPYADSYVREKANLGDTDARRELIRRGLAGDPDFIAQARISAKRPWRDSEYDDRPRMEPNPMVTR